MVKLDVKLEDVGNVIFGYLSENIPVGKYVIEDSKLECWASEIYFSGRGISIGVDRRGVIVLSGTSDVVKDIIEEIIGDNDNMNPETTEVIFRLPNIRISAYDSENDISTTITDINRIYELTMLLISKLPLIRSNIVRIYNTYIDRVNRLLNAMSRVVEEDNNTVKTKNMNIEEFSEEYEGVWYPIRNDRELKAVLAKIFRF